MNIDSYYVPATIFIDFEKAVWFRRREVGSGDADMACWLFGPKNFQSINERAVGGLFYIENFVPIFGDDSWKITRNWKGRPAGWFDGRTDGKPLRAKTISTPEDSVIDVLIIKALDVKLGP